MRVWAAPLIAAIGLLQALSPAAASTIFQAKHLQNDIVVNEYDSSGHYFGVIDAGESLTDVVGFAASPTGGVAVASYEGHEHATDLLTITAFGPNQPRTSLVIGSPISQVPTTLGFAINSSGDLLLPQVEPFSGGINLYLVDEYSSTGHFLTNFALRDQNGQPFSPMGSLGFALDAAGHILVARAAAGTIFVDCFSAGGAFVSEVPLLVGNAVYTPGDPFFGFGVEASGDLAIETYTSGRTAINEFDTSGKYLDGFYLTSADPSVSIGTPFALAFGPDSPSGVPEPGSWTLMLLGFTALGASLRRARGDLMLPSS